MLFFFLFYHLLEKEACPLHEGPKLFSVAILPHSSIDSRFSPEKNNVRNMALKQKAQTQLQIVWFSREGACSLPAACTLVGSGAEHSLRVAALRTVPVCPFASLAQLLG